jgi:hypothetical protein
MKTTHTFIVHFWLKKKSIRKDGTTPIYKHNPPKIIKEGESRDFVLTVPKFTFGD